jgi:predicted GNAT family N-acyltransferase
LKKEDNQLSDQDVKVYNITKAINESVNLSYFKCEKQYFADYLRLYAKQDDDKGIGKLWLFVNGNNKVIGYVTLAMSQLSKSQHLDLGRMTPRTYVPGILIGEMARDIDYKGRGLGNIMINWVVSKARDLSKEVACRIIIVEAEEDKIDIYKKWGFEPIENFEERRNTMFLRIK